METESCGMAWHDIELDRKMTGYDDFSIDRCGDSYDVTVYNSILLSRLDRED